MKNNRIVKIFLIMFILFLNITNFEKVNAASEGIGVKVFLKDISGNIIAQGVVLRRSDSSYTGSYRVSSILPVFDSSNSPTVLSQWTQSESNVISLMNAAGIGVPVSQAKINNYVLVVEAIYKGTKTQYRKTVVDGSGVTCAEWGTKEETYYECKSEFIRNNSYGFSHYFTGCGTGNWNTCDKNDGYTR